MTTSFDDSEYADRLARVRARMMEADLETLITVDPSNMAWLTGYDGWSFYVHQAVIVPASGDPVWWGRPMDAPGAVMTTWLSKDRVHSYPDEYVMSPHRHAMDDLAGLLADYGWARGRIGVEMENYYYSARAHSVLDAAVPGTLADATGLVNRCRAVKSPAELARMRRAARIVERMHVRIREIMRPGLRGNELAAEITRTALMGAEDEGGAFGGDYPAIVPLIPAGREASAAHLTWSDRPYPADVGIFFEIAGCYRRYHAPLCRTAWLGRKPDNVRRAEATMREAVAAGIDAARAGAVAGDVARAFHGSLRRSGIERLGRCGYPIGLSYPPDWGERTFSIREEDETVLEPDMTFHFMGGLWQADWGLEITESLRVRRDGPAECLANVPQEIFECG